jgi:hypothetical protein
MTAVHPPTLLTAKGARVNEQQAIEAARQIGVALGDHITLQSDGQIVNDHYHRGQTAGDKHVDGWLVENNGGTYIATKLHSDDV